ncbi:MAG: hypothetical protein HZC50_01095 [Nitrospirae bacterium]|nr:hypothetical protein [Nitrospirota bacterium]
MSVDEQADSTQTTPYQAAGELAGITRLVDEFYVNMDTLPEAKTIRNMHPEDLTESRKKLTYFLSGWLGGPRLFQQHYGPISIPGGVLASLRGSTYGPEYASPLRSLRPCWTAFLRILRGCSASFQTSISAMTQRPT